MSDEDDGFVETASQSAEFPLKFGAGDGVEGAEGLVHKENRRIGGESARDADALALAAGKFMRVARGKFNGIETYQPQQFFDAGGDSRGIPFFESRNEADVLPDGEMWEQASFLNDVADPATESDGIAFGGRAAFDEHLPLRRDEHAVDEFKERGFAAAAASQENQGLPYRDGQ